SFAFTSGVLLGLTLIDLFPESMSDFGTSYWFDAKWASSLATALFIVTVFDIKKSFKKILET
ncbi:3827_t:CDS:1, partial [Gigaspora margarita]